MPLVRRNSRPSGASEFAKVWLRLAKVNIMTGGTLLLSISHELTGSNFTIQRTFPARASSFLPVSIHSVVRVKFWQHCPIS